MQELLEKSNINFVLLKKFIHRTTASELAKLSEPCYYPSLKKYYYELLHICNLKEVDIKAYVKRTYKGRPEAKWKLQVDPISNFYIFLMHAFLQRREITAYKSMMIFFVIRNYTNLMNKQIQYCNEEVFRYALENLAKTHLFIREKSIPGAIFFLANEMNRIFNSGIKENSVDIISKFITQCRTRVSQSIKSFAELYYKASEEGLGIRQPYEDESDDGKNQQLLDKTSRVITEIVKNITVYKVIDHKAINEARTLTKIRASLATLIANNITEVKFADNIKLILELFVKDLSSVELLCGTGFFNYVRSLMSIKRTNQKIYFKQQINVLLNEVIIKLDYQEDFSKLTKQTQSLVNMYLAYYITIFMKNSVCQK